MARLPAYRQDYPSGVVIRRGMNLEACEITFWFQVGEQTFFETYVLTDQIAANHDINVNLLSVEELLPIVRRLAKRI